MDETPSTHPDNDDDTTRRPFAPTADPKPNDLVNVQVPRWMLDLVRDERDRTSPPTDSFGNPRQREGLNTVFGRLALAGLKWSREAIPTYVDPYADLAEAFSGERPQD